MTKKLHLIASLGMMFIFFHANSQNKQDFSMGWSDGYKEGYCNYNLEHRKMKPNFIVPISPIPPIGYKTYEDGYRLGLMEGKEKFLKQCRNCEIDESQHSSYISGQGSFDDGWKAGYEDGYSEFNLLHHKMKPIFIVPITPIAPIGYDEYKDGYCLGFRKGKDDFSSK